MFLFKSDKTVLGFSVIATFFILIGAYFFLTAINYPSHMIVWTFVCFFLISMLFILYAYYLWIRSLISKVLILNKKLLEDKDIDKYIEEHYELLKGMMTYNVIAAIKLNLVLGYILKKNYTTAQRIIDEINPNRLANILRSSYYMKFIYLQYKQEHIEVANALVNKHRDMLIEFEEHPHLGPIVSLIFICESHSKFDPITSATLIERASKKWSNTIYHREILQMNNLLFH